MASENEKVMDVLEETRVCATAADPTIWGDARIAKLVITTKKQQLEYCDRLEAARKREKAEAEAAALSAGGIVEAARQKPVGNAAAMREALERLRTEIERFYNNEWIPYDAWQGCDDVISHALSAPARNCDVGTAEEQYKRYEKFCCSHYRIADTGSGNCLKCPFAQPVCKLAWSQMPYEEGASA